jgi:16S rRNA (guanine527-N7)-methyltransferase
MKDSLTELLASGAAEMGIALDGVALERFSVYLELLQLWGRKINLTTRLEAEAAIVYHFLDSLAGVPLLARSSGSRVVDLGTGAGLPSLPLKFALPGLRLVLVESVRKKAAFCQEVVRATASAGVEVVWGRGETVGAGPRHRQAFDWAVSRALGSAADVARLALPFLAPGGRILLYKGDPDAGELDALDAFCGEHRAARELNRVSVPHVKGARCLITIIFPGVSTGQE